MKIKTALLLLTMAYSAVQAQVNIDIDAQNRGPRISPTHYGIFFEDINHAADGGLYAELIRNRSFEDGPRYGAPADMQGWTTYAAAPSQLQAKLIQPTKKAPLLNAVQHNALELTVNATPASPVCLVNEGFWGINTVQGRTYRLSFWAKALKYKGGAVKATLCSKDGGDIYAEASITLDTKSKEWKKYTATLQANDNDPKAQFALVFDGTGVVCLDVVSLFPPTFRNRENGMRPDLANMLWQMHPKFMRFPGGCFVEGQESPDNAFRWKRTIGPIEEREGHWNVNWGYRTTDGIGFHEYLQLAEDLGAKPLYVVNVGLWHGGLTPVDSLQPWIDETLGALEYANGPVSSKYGALRAKYGHPEPFNIEYLEIGNENNQPDPRQQSDRYYDRYNLFYKAIKAKYPNIKLIGNVVAWGDDNPRWESQLPVDLLDEHYYRTPGWFAEAFHKYDRYDRRGPKIYVGEYAVTNGFGDLGNMNAALGEAVYMMGMENNSDIVPLNSYAPIFVNENDAKWRPDMIRFNSSRVMGTPSYYVQMLMPRNVGTQVVKVSQQNPYENMKRKPVTPKRSRVGYSTWGTQASYTHCDPLPKTGKPEFVSGKWEMNDGILQHKGREEGPLAICNHVIDSDHYTIQCRARKDRGPEGFIIVFNYVDERNYCWLNFGGWGNTQHAIEQIGSGGKLQTVIRRGRVEQGKWYDVKLQVAGDSVKAWLGDELVFDTVLKHDTSKGVYSSATIDEASGELIVKLVNTGDMQTTASLNLKNFRAREARVIRLAANDGMDENTLQQPTNIHPVEQVLTPACESAVLVDVPAYSLNIVRIKQ
ncbi:MAG: carbohydrate binding domain-containing protein [Prevotella sp.]|nr:carbohydrate binding domain-containing protein [Prevotella sp.]